MGIDFERVFEGGPAAVALLSRDLTVAAASRAFLRARRTSREALLGRRIDGVLLEDPALREASGAANVRASFERVLKDKVEDSMALQRYDVEHGAEDKGRFEERHWLIVNSPILDASGEVEYILHRIEDVTGLVEASRPAAAAENREDARAVEMGRAHIQAELYRHLQDIRRANLKLRQSRQDSDDASAARTRFFASVSHELRTPLTLILGPARRLLDDPSVRADHKAVLKTVERNATVLLAFINELLDVSRLQLGKGSLVFADADLGQMTRVVAGHFDSLAAERHIRYEIAAPERALAQVDVEKLTRVLVNILGNAFRFAPPGGRVTCSLETRADSAVFTIEDSGPGVPPEVQKAVFEPFSNVSLVSGGSGLGLSIAKEFVELHGGKISIEKSRLGGARFVVALPTHPPAATPVSAGADSVMERTQQALAVASATRAPVEAGPLPEPPPGAPVILIVEDNPEMNRFIAETLARDYRVVRASNGEEGLRVLRDRAPDLILTDMMMPRMDGRRMIEEIRRRPETEHIPIIVLSARTDERLRTELLERFVQDYVVKPFWVEELRARVAAQIRLRKFNELLEKQVAERTARLTAANEELEAFSYSVAHDLRSPLRSVVSFAQLARAEPADKLGPKSGAYLEQIEASGRRMARLVDALLLLSRVSRKELRREPVDLSALALGALEDHRAAEPQREVESRVAPGLSCRGDSELLELVVRQLIDNAWKYSSKTPRARIEFGREGAAGPFFVRDNGIGFSMAHAGKIFGVFQRLHSQEQYPGTGIGLATVKRVIDRHGGTLRAEASPGEGAAFYFSLP